jgi:1-acyl-sn-glycerol-3-phosphate acyltransferase
VRDGVSIWMAPEGTRSRDGTIGALKKGGFHLALETGTPIVPVAVRGTIDILPRGGRVMRTGQPVHVAIGAPIAVAGRDLPGLMAEVRDFLVREVEGGQGKSSEIR